MRSAAGRSVYVPSATVDSRYSFMSISCTAWMSLREATRACTLVRSSLVVLSMRSIICCCLSIQYRWFPNTVRPTGCRMFESAITIRLAPAVLTKIKAPGRKNKGENFRNKGNKMGEEAGGRGGDTVKHTFHLSSGGSE